MLLQLLLNLSELLITEIEMQHQIGIAHPQEVDFKLFGGDPVAGKLFYAGDGRNGICKVGLKAAKHIAGGIG